MAWRPKNWENPHNTNAWSYPDELTWHCVTKTHDAFETGADAMYNAMLKHLNEDCGLHTLNLIHGEGNWKQWLKDCFKEE